MLRRLVRALSVVAIAVTPAIVVPGASQAAPARYPVWPSFLSTGCNTVSGGSNGTTISCGTGAFLLTQVNSGYQCSQVDININSFSSGPFTVTATSQDGTQQNTVSINDNGDYYMQFPNFLVNNTLVIQMSAPDSGAMNVGFIATSPCPVAPTNTPVPPTNTPNPSDTATNTATAGPSHTPTTIPTNTPLPSGHSTFTATATPTNSPTVAVTATPVPPPCPFGWGFYACHFEPSVYTGSWVQGVSPWHTASDTYGGGGQFDWGCYINVFGSTNPPACKNASVYQLGTLPALGKFCITATNWWTNGGYLGWRDSTDTTWISSNTSINPGQTTTICMTSDTPGGTTVALYVGSSGDSGFSNMEVTFIPAGSTTPVGTYTTTPTAAVPPLTSTAIAAETQTAVASSFTPTPIPIPGAQSTAIPTDTECPGGCAVAKLTSVPGLGTVTTVDTSPFSPLAHLSLSRSSCQPFGYAQIPVPVIHGTPALGSTTPLSVTWTVPVTGAWTNYNSDGTLNISNTAIQPCAMSEIPTFVWDLTYWLSVLMCAIAWFLWLIGFVGRLSGEETING